MLSPTTAKPTAEGMVSKRIMFRDRARVARKSSIRPAAALREMAGNDAEATATPNNPSGNWRNRNAYPSQLTGPFITCPEASVRVEARLVYRFTKLYTDHSAPNASNFFHR